MIFLRVYEGIREHFPIRRMEWMMVYPAAGMSVAFTVQPDMFDVSPSFEVLQRWADEPTWAAVCFALAFARLFALTINGTFHSFRWSPLLRAGASLFGTILWANITVGFAAAYLFGHGGLSPVVAWSTLSIAEALNVYQTWGDLGQTLRGKRHA